MMAEQYYPALPDKFVFTLRVLAGNCSNGVDLYLDDPLCPYDEPAKELFRKLFGGRAGDDTCAVEEIDASYLESEAVAIYRDLKNLFIAEEDVKEKIQQIKARAGLLDKLLSIQERAFNVKNMADFQDRVIEFMDSVLTDDQRLTFLGKVRGDA